MRINPSQTKGVEWLCAAPALDLHRVSTDQSRIKLSGGSGKEKVRQLVPTDILQNE